MKKDKKICFNFQRNLTCKNGDSCAFSHDQHYHKQRNDFQALHYQKASQVSKKKNAERKENNSEESTNIWVPPGDLQKKDKGLGYTIQFPLELTNKDYLRRVLDLTCIGIRSRIVQITAESGFTKIAKENDGDIFYLLKQLLGGKGFEDPKNAVTVMIIRSKFAESLGTSVDKMVNAAKYLFIRRNQLAHASAESHSQEYLISAFAYAIELLECFGSSAAVALQAMHDLSEQYQENMRFKKDRIRQLGWLQNTEIDSQNDVKDLDFVLFDEDHLDNSQTNSTVFLIIRRCSSSLS